MKTFAPQGIEPNGGGGALSSNVSKLGSKEVIRHAELADCELRAELDGKMAKPLQTSIADPLNASNQAVSASHNETVFSLFTSHFSRKRVAFTLAEVLITLGVIGVVASLTLPSVITKYQDKVLINNTKKAFAQFQNVLSLASVDNGTPGDNSLTFPKDVSSTTVTENLAKYYKGAQVCLSPNQKGCSKYYYNIMYGVPQYNNNGEAVYQSGSGYKFVTIDGTIFTISSNHTGCDRTRYTGITTNNAGEIIYNSDGTPKTYDYYSSICANIDVDVNGVKGPNQYGRDVFHFWVYANKLDYNTGKGLGGDSLKNIFSGKDELVYTKYKVTDSKK